MLPADQMRTEPCSSLQGIKREDRAMDNLTSKDGLANRQHREPITKTHAPRDIGVRPRGR
eukprot:9032897-Pyramimonas_sp.AAC.1